VVQKGTYANIPFVENNPHKDLKVLRNHKKIDLIKKVGEIYQNMLAQRWGT
jgi:hypothetical protein